MTESTLLTDPDPASSGGADNRRMILLVGCGLAAATVVTGGLLLLTGGDDAEQVTAGPIAQAPRVAPPASTPSARPIPAQPVQVPRGRNPFLALPAGAGAPAGAAPTDLPSQDTSGSQVAPAPVEEPVPAPVQQPVAAPEEPVQEPVPLPDRAPPAAPEQRPVAAPAPGVDKPGPVVRKPVPLRRVVLRRVTGSGRSLSAVFTVDGRSVTVRPGSTFGPSKIRLISIQQEPGPLQYLAVLQAAPGRPFDLALGKAVSVR